MYSEEVFDADRHLVDLSGIVLLDIPKDSDVVDGDKVDGDTLATKATGPADAMDVVFSIAGQVVVDAQAHPRDVDAPGPDIGGNEDAAVALAELVHDLVPLPLLHLAVHR